MPTTRTRRRLASVVLSSVLSFASVAHADVLVPPKVVDNVEPLYPEGKTEDAVVVLELTVDKEGRVTAASVRSSGGEPFDQAALAAAKSLRFAPATRDGSPIVARIPFTFTFKAPAPAPTSALEGSLRTKQDEPIAGATVTVSAGEKVLATAVTDAKGSFRIASLTPGKVHVAIAADGFSPFAADEELAAGNATVVVYRATPITTPDATPGEVLEIDVVGDRPAREVTRRVLEGDVMKKMPGTNGDPLRAVEAMPGVARPPGLSGLLIVRGSSPDDTAIFVDGVWIPLAYHFGGITSVIPGDVVERIDFLPGNFGPDRGRAIGGVVDLAIRSPRKDRFGGLLQVDLLDGRTMIEGPLSDRTRVLVAARRSWVDAWLGPVLRSSGTGVITAPVYQDAQFVLEHDLSDRTTLRLAAFGSDDRLALLFESPSAQDPTLGGAFSGRESFVRVQLRSDTRLPGGGRFMNMLSWGPNWERFSLGPIDVHSNFAMTQWRSDLRAPIAEGVTGIVGVDVLGISADVSMRVPPNPPAGSTNAPIFGRPVRELGIAATYWWPGAYAMLDLAPGAGIHLLPGLRFDYSADTERLNVDPRLAMRWTVGQGTTLKGGIGLYHQPPQPNESIEPWGTPGLRNPSAVHTSVGVEQDLGSGFDLSLEAFHKQFRDLVIARAAESDTASGTRYENSGSGRAYGLELLAKGKHGRFSGWVAYTLSRSERRDAPGEPLLVYTFDQTHILTALGSYELGRGWSVGARWRYVSGQPYTPYVGGVVDVDAGSYAPVAGARNSARLGPYHALDLRVEKQWNFTAWRLAAYLDVRNAYNRKNPEGTVYRYDYAESQPTSGLPILPIVGVRGEL